MSGNQCSQCYSIAMVASDAIALTAWWLICPSHFQCDLDAMDSLSMQFPRVAIALSTWPARGNRHEDDFFLHGHRDGITMASQWHRDGIAIYSHCQFVESDGNGLTARIPPRI